MSPSPNQADLADETLAQRLGQGDKTAFDPLYRRYSGRTLHYFLRMFGGDRQKAEDFVQELFLKVVEKSASFDGRPFSTWLFAMAHHLCCNEYRRLHVRRGTTNGEVDQVLPAVPLTSAADALEHRYFKEALTDALDQLDQLKRSTFLLRFQEEFSIQQISLLMDCPVGTVKSRLFYAVRFLAQRLQPFNPRNDGEPIP